jgi:hypothetical protein
MFMGWRAVQMSYCNNMSLLLGAIFGSAGVKSAGLVDLFTRAPPEGVAQGRP